MDDANSSSDNSSDAGGGASGPATVGAVLATWPHPATIVVWVVITLAAAGVFIAYPVAGQPYDTWGRTATALAASVGFGAGAIIRPLLYRLVASVPVHGRGSTGSPAAGVALRAVAFTAFAVPIYLSVFAGRHPDSGVGVWMTSPAGLAMFAWMAFSIGVVSSGFIALRAASADSPEPDGQHGRHGQG